MMSFYREHKSEKDQNLGSNLSFEYAFGVEEDFMKKKIKAFTLADNNAAWRKEKATEAQLNILKKHRFKAGIDKLTKGQAAIIISSGVLKRGHS